MRNIVICLFWGLILLSRLDAQPMAEKIKEQITKLFVYTDEQKWDNVRTLFADEVLLDYSSFTGIEAAVMTPGQLIDGWSGFLPGFAATHHQVSNYLVDRDDKRARLTCYGTASHYLPNESGKNVWIVVGTYDFGLLETEAGWKINKMIFNFKYQDGNTDLPKLIQTATGKDK